MSDKLQTQLEQTQLALLASETRLRNLVLSNPDAILIVDLNGIVRFMNPAAEQLFGRSAKQMTGQSFGFPVVAGETADLDIVQANGAVGVAQMRVVKTQWEDQPVFLTSLRDISVQQQLMNELSATASKLERSNGELEQFAYIASHDLQEPLRKVSAFCELLAKEYGHKLDGDAAQYMHFIKDGAARMHVLIKDLLAFSRIGLDNQEDRETSVQDSLNDALVNLETVIEEAGAEVTQDQLPVVRANRRQLSHLLQKLIINAIKYRKDAPPKIHVGVESDHDRWIFSVTDNGIGIELKNLEKVFNIFTRLHVPSEYPDAGTGIGLAICRRIVDRLDGDIWAESEHGVGSVFRFSIKKL
ncbi:ATP-binding protein [Mariniblastus sp.]|nr:ATP-binding protein [Mariniblastus sp.]